MSANTFLLALSQYQQVIGSGESEALSRILPVALVDQPSQWNRMIGHTASALDDFREMFKEFLPYDYQLHLRQELGLRTQAAEESLVEHVRAMQELDDCADPEASNSERVERVARPSHPTFALYLRSCDRSDLNELAAEARRVQAAIAASRAYRPPPPPAD